MINEIKSVIEKHKEHIPVKVTAELLAVIDGAEAEVCEWKQANDKFENTCGRTRYTHFCSCIRFFKFCPYCGKRKKIVGGGIDGTD